jgi:hypothetical protein
MAFMSAAGAAGAGPWAECLHASGSFTSGKTLETSFQASVTD